MSFELGLRRGQIGSKVCASMPFQYFNFQISPEVRLYITFEDTYPTDVTWINSVNFHC